MNILIIKSGRCSTPPIIISLRSAIVRVRLNLGRHCQVAAGRGNFFLQKRVYFLVERSVVSESGRLLVSLGLEASQYHHGALRVEEETAISHHQEQIQLQHSSHLLLSGCFLKLNLPYTDRSISIWTVTLDILSLYLTKMCLK